MCAQHFASVHVFVREVAGWGQHEGCFLMRLGGPEEPMASEGVDVSATQRFIGISEDHSLFLVPS